MLDRRQHRKPLARAPQIQRIGMAGLFRARIDARRRRTAPALRHHIGHNFRRSRKQRLDAAVAAIAHPAFKIVRHGAVLDPGAVTDALHPAADCHLTDCAAHLSLESQKFSAARFHICIARDAAGEV